MSNLRELFFTNYFVKWFILGTFIGIVAGFGAVSFYLLLKYTTDFFMNYIVGYPVPKPLGEGGSSSFYQFIIERPWLIPIVTTIGGLLSGVIVYKFAPEAEGHGTDAAISAFHHQAGRIRARIPIIKTIASAITIGSGGSAGREGPTAQIAAGIGSIIASLLKLDDRDRRIALTVGIGAGIGSIFRAPLGGALFGAEVLYRRDIEVEAIYPALIAGVVGYAIFSSLITPQPVFGTYIGYFRIEHLPLYILLGVIAGLFGRLYAYTFYKIRDIFRKLNIPKIIKPAIGGLLTGLIGLAFPQVLGTSYGWLQFAISGNYSVFELYGLNAALVLLILAVLKILATSFSIGSGGSGGVFAPGIVIGGFLGASIGLFLHMLNPNLIDYKEIPSMVIVGMMSFFGGVSKAPISVMVMVTEMTGGLHLLPPTMIATAISYVVCGKYSIYESQLPTRRDSPAHWPEFVTPLLRRIKVRDVGIRKIKPLLTNTPVKSAINEIENGKLIALPVIDTSGKFIGIVHLRDLVIAKDKTIEKIVKPCKYVSLESTLDEALTIMAENDIDFAPVVENGVYIGVVTLEAEIKAYREALRKIYGR